MQPKSTIWASWALSGIPILMLGASATLKFMGGAGLAEGFGHLGIPAAQAFPLGVVEILCAILYLVPGTSVLGAILLTGYLGGATFAHVRVGDPFFIQPLLGVFLWGGLYLRDARIRALIPL